VLIVIIISTELGAIKMKEYKMYTDEENILMMTKDESVKLISDTFLMFADILLKMREKNLKNFVEIKNEYVLKGTHIIDAIKIQKECPVCKGVGYIEFYYSCQFSNFLLESILLNCCTSDVIAQEKKYNLPNEKEIFELIYYISLGFIYFRCRRCNHENMELVCSNEVRHDV
jgi:hypothetical protein